MRPRLLYMIPVLLILSDCGPSVRFVVTGGGALNWGAGPSRRNLSDVHLTPPLETVWEYRLNASPGRSLSAADSIAAFGAADGKIHFVHIATGDGETVLKDRNKIESTCVLTDSFLIIVKRIGRNTLRAVHRVDLSERWTANAGPVEGEPLVLDFRVFTGADDGFVRCFEIRTGREVWQRKLSGRVRGSLCSDGRRIYVVTDDQAIHALSEETGASLWCGALQGPCAAGPVVSGGIVSAGCTNGWAGAFQSGDGRLLWQARLEGGVFSPPAVDSEAFYFGTSQGKLIKLRRETGGPMWLASISGVFGTPPVLSGNTLYIGSLNRKILAFDIRSGAPVWEAEIKGRCRTAPILWKGRLLVGTEGRIVYGFVPAP